MNYTKKYNFYSFWKAKNSIVHFFPCYFLNYKKYSEYLRNIEQLVKESIFLDTRVRCKNETKISKI